MHFALDAFRGFRKAALVTACLLTLSTSAAPRSDEVWITIERGRLGAFEAVERLPDANQVAVALRINLGGSWRRPSRKNDRRPGAVHAGATGRGGFIAHLSGAVGGSRLAAGPSWRRHRRSTARSTTHPWCPARWPVQETNIRNTISSLESFFTRYHSCHATYNSAGWIKALWEGYAAGRRDVKVEFFNHPPATTPQPSVVLTIQAGTSVGPVETEIVVLGAHQDSVAGSNCSTSRSPGGDDDASGVASLSEVIRAAMALGYSPQKTVKFMACAAESGPQGLGAIAQACSSRRQRDRRPSSHDELGARRPTSTSSRTSPTRRRTPSWASSWTPTCPGSPAALAPAATAARTTPPGGSVGCGSRQVRSRFTAA
jgi:leucyl aminopeptidase